LPQQSLLDGTPRFKLTWQGSDDFDISAKSPQGNLISLENPLDNLSTGFREDNIDYTSDKCMFEKTRSNVSNILNHDTSLF
jgi:hypothetical protein